MAKKLAVTLKRSTISRPKDQRATVRSLGLRKIGQTVEHEDNPVIRGMISKVSHLVEVTAVSYTHLDVYKRQVQPVLDLRAAARIYS